MWAHNFIWIIASSLDNQKLLEINGNLKNVYSYVVMYLINFHEVENSYFGI